MKILLYVLATLAGLFGILALVRTIEVAALGGGINLVQVLIAIICLFLAVLWIKRARTK